MYDHAYRAAIVDLIGCDCSKCAQINTNSLLMLDLQYLICVHLLQSHTTRSKIHVMQMSKDHQSAMMLYCQQFDHV